VLTVLLLAAALFCWGALSARLERADLTAPIVFVAVGFSLSQLTPLETHVEAEALKILTEVTLVWVLFSDAAQVGLNELRADAGVYVRLLGVALPVTVVLGWALAAWLIGGLGIWLALFVGAALAPTDAALGAAIMGDRRVPARVRRIVNVESGLNDGIVTPISCSRSQALRPRRGSLTLRVCGKRWPSWLSVWSWAQASAWGRLVAAPDAP
jgi:NhaP-type Na+/H+ or K+/H+ antiporter